MHSDRIDSLTKMARLLFKVDSTIADIKLRLYAARTGLGLAALLIGVFGFTMLGVAAFYTLEQFWGPIWAALAVAGASFLLAFGLAAAALMRKPGRELELAYEMHQTTLEALVAEAKSTTRDLTSVDLRHPFDNALLGLVGPLASILVKGLRKGEKKDDQP